MRRDAVLVVDDEPAVLKLVQTMLEHFGFATLGAESGYEALVLLNAHHVDALLTDVVMPGMSGPELIEEVRRRRPGLPISCMSGNAFEAHTLLKQVPIIRKPFVTRQLIDTLRQSIDTRAHCQADQDLAQIDPLPV